MTSAIDTTKPVGPIAYTADVRSNLAIARQEISALQAVVADPRTYGILFDGSDETAAFQSYLDDCRDNAVNWFLPADLVADGLTFYTSGRAADGARILAVNNGQNAPVVTVAPAATDVLNVPSSEYSAWGGLFRGSSQISGLVGRRGQYIMIVQSDLNIGRLGGGAFNQMVGFVVWSDAGDIYPPLTDNLTWPGSNTVVTAQITRHQVEIKSLVVEMSDPPGGTPVGERNRVVQVVRCNTTIRDCQVRSDCVSVGIQQGFVVSNSSSVQFDRCVVDNIRGSGTTNYGYNSGVAAIITLVDCQARKTRRGFDGESVNMVRIRGGAFDGGIGAHWGHDIDVTGAMIALDYLGGSQIALWFAGGNIRVHDCNISMTSVAKGIMGVRSDLFEMYGVFELSNNRIFIDNRNNAIGATAAIQLMIIAAAGNPAQAYDTLRPVALPSLIRMVGNWVSFLGPSTADITLLSLLNDYTAMPQTITVDGAVVIEDNRFDLENGIIDGNNNPRLNIINVRPLNQIGGGYRFRIRGLPCLYIYTHCNHTVVNAASRHSFLVSEVTGPTQMFQSAGAFSRLGLINCLGTIKVSIPGGGSGYTPIGDEVIYSLDQSTMSHAFYTMTGTRQQALLLTNVGGGGYVQISNGSNFAVVQAQGPGDISLIVQSRGSGYLQIGQDAAPMLIRGTSINVTTGAVFLDTQNVLIGDDANTGTGVYLNSGTGPKFIKFNTASSTRWQVNVQDAGGGSNTGDNFSLTRFDDTGNPILNSISINRASGGIVLSGPIGFQGSGYISKPSVVGSRGGNAALASLLTALDSYGLIDDNTVA